VSQSNQRGLKRSGKLGDVGPKMNGMRKIAARLIRERGSVRRFFVGELVVNHINKDQKPIAFS